MKHANGTTQSVATSTDGLKSSWTALVLLGAMSVSGAAVAQVTGTPAPASEDQSLTWHGITLYGIVDVGLQYENHGAPFNDYHPASSENIVNKNSRQSVTGLTSSNLSQSRVGLQGNEPIYGDWSAVFKLETFFNPSTGDISDALKGITQNNGRTPATQNTDLDSSVAGEMFQTAYAGVSSKTFGTITFGRQLTMIGEGVNKYDPNNASQAFSLIGMSGNYAGGGATEDKRVDSSLKYYGTFADMIHVGAIYKFNNSNGAANTLYQGDLGFEYAGASIDAYYGKTNSAIAASSLSAAQVATLPALGISVSNALAATVSDNTTIALMGLYTFGPAKFYLGYENIKFANPKNALPVGFDDIGGYILAVVNNDAYAQEKIWNVYWAGVKYTAAPGLDLTAAFYGYHQSAYGTGDLAGCDNNSNSKCAGTFESFSFDAVYAVSHRFDVYGGIMYSAVHDGLANGYAYQTNNINPTIGVRFKF